MLRPADIDRSSELWEYRPPTHKTEHHGRDRVIIIGPKAQAILMPYLLRAPEVYCFSPAESEQKRRADRHLSRKVPLSCGNRPGTKRARKPKRAPRDRYDTESYSNAIRKAIKRVNRNRVRTAAVDEQPVLLEHWAPNRLRHRAATEIRKRYGLEAAQVILGHSRADVTQIYAERDQVKAQEVMREVG